MKLRKKIKLFLHLREIIDIIQGFDYNKSK